MSGLEISGLEQLDAGQKKAAEAIISKGFEKLKRVLKNEVLLLVNVKEYSHKKGDSSDMRAKYSISAEIKSPTHAFEASDADWELNRALHKIFNKLNSEIEHRFHISEQGKA